MSFEEGDGIDPNFNWHGGIHMGFDRTVPRTTRWESDAKTTEQGAVTTIIDVCRGNIRLHGTTQEYYKLKSSDDLKKYPYHPDISGGNENDDSDNVANHETQWRIRLYADKKLQFTKTGFMGEIFVNEEKIYKFEPISVNGYFGFWKHLRSSAMTIGNINVTRLKDSSMTIYNIINSDLSHDCVRKAVASRKQIISLEKLDNILMQDLEENEKEKEKDVEDVTKEEKSNEYSVSMSERRDDIDRPKITPDTLILQPKAFTFGHKNKDDLYDGKITKHINLLHPKLVGSNNIPFSIEFNMKFHDIGRKLEDLDIGNILASKDKESGLISGLNPWVYTYFGGLYMGFDNQLNFDETYISWKLNGLQENKSSNGYTCIDYSAFKQLPGFRVFNKTGTIDLRVNKYNDPENDYYSRRNELNKLNNPNGKWMIIFDKNSKNKSKIECTFTVNDSFICKFEPKQVEGGIGFYVRRGNVMTVSDIKVTKMNEKEDDDLEDFLD